MAIACVYPVWRHLPADATIPRLYLYIFAALLTLSITLEGMVVAIRNGLFYHRWSHAVLRTSNGMAQLRLQLSRPIKTEPGQYIQLWLPSASFWAFAQSHPFVVTSWDRVPQTTLDLFIQPRQGFTRNLLRLYRPGDLLRPRWALFSGPHGQTAPVEKYEKVMMVADGAGIAAQLPYLKKLIHGYHARQVVTRHIHLIWHIHNIGIPAFPVRY